MIRKLIFIITFTSVIAACTAKEEKIPANIIPEDKMKNILIDIHILEGVVNTSGGNADTLSAKYKIMEEKLFARHKVQKIQFDSSMAYYSRHLKRLDSIYVDVIDSLSVREALKKVD